MFWKKKNKWVHIKNKIFDVSNIKEISASPSNIHIKFYEGKEENIAGEEKEVEEIYNKIKQDFLKE